MAFTLWVIGRAQQSGAAWSRPLGWIALLLGFVALAELLPLVGSGAPAGSHLRAGAVPAQAYSEARLQELRTARRGVFIDATAAWCITCLVNEKTALNSSRVRGAFAVRRIVFLVADWTNRDPAVTALLQAHARSGVPLYLYYAPGASQAIVLPQILTADNVLAAIGAR